MSLTKSNEKPNMKQTDCISVIVPVYNIEAYLPECIESILKQTYTNLEIILVDDGSTDSSGQICDTFEKKDSRVVVIHKKNGGLSDARNAGLQIVKGKYIAFVDGDDFIDPHMYEYLYESIIKNQADVAYGVTQRMVRQYYENEPNGEESILENEQILNAYICGEQQPHILKAAWDKLYTKEIIGETRFIKGIHGEDGPFNLEVLGKSKKCVFVGKIVYYYRDVRDGSISSVGISERLFTDKIPVLRMQIDMLRKFEREDLAQRQQCVFYNELLHYYRALRNYEKAVQREYRERICKLVREEKELVYSSFKYDYAGIKYKLKMLLFIHLPVLFN